MTRLRVLTVCALLCLPFLVLLGMGMYHLWSTGLIFWVWWPLAGCFAAGYILAWRWQNHYRKESLKADIPEHGTELDKQAWKIVERFAAHSPTRAQLDDSQFYFRQARDLSEEIARVYHPHSKTPLGSVTMPELLTAMELAASELRQKVEAYVPGSHLWTINNVQQTSVARIWAPRLTNAMWLGSAVLDPLKTGIRYIANRYGVSKPLDLFQDNLVGWFYANFVHRVGHYLIELYSGRLKVGAEQYRKMMRQADAEPTAGIDAALPPLRFAVVGRATSGKTDLVRAVTGQAKIEAPSLEAIEHRLELRDVADEIRIVDTPPYAGLTDRSKKAFERCIDEADLILWVVAADWLNDEDKAYYRVLQEYFHDRPNRKQPPVLLVMTEVESLSPRTEWQPPYNWQEPNTPKEHAIATAAAKLRDELADPWVSIVPVNVGEQKVWNVEEFLDPMILLNLTDARAVARLRGLTGKGREGRVGKVFDQVFSGGKQILGGIMGRLRKT